jgi:hypothetical protein
MASIKLTGDTSGVITVSAPAAAGTNTITLPATTGTMALTSDITTEIPSQTGNSGKYLTTNGSASSWGTVASGGLTLLKTVATSSGTTVVAADLDLSTYKTLIVEFWSCSPDTTEDTSIRWANTGGTAQKLGVNGTNASQGYYGRVTHDLVNKYVWTNVFNRDQTDLDGTLFMSGAEVSLGVNNQITTSTTSLTFDWFSGQDFDGGSILIYGLK